MSKVNTNPTNVTEWEDCIGQTMKVGDVIAVSVTARQTSDLLIGTIVRFNTHDSKGNQLLAGGGYRYADVGSPDNNKYASEGATFSGKMHGRNVWYFPAKQTVTVTVELSKDRWTWRAANKPNGGRVHTYTNLKNIVKIKDGDI